ncbi:MAG: hypothetical protein QOF76_2616 [Solirubrobacteraceae bacterium]|jgi:hypothetical protein|nr:hypothetical protein [Solirubrobacteraceae bacterium]
MRKSTVGALACVSALAAMPVSAGHATSATAAYHCPIGDSGVTYNRSGQAALFKRLSPFAGMTCSSAQYVLNHWIRPYYANRYTAKLPRKFYDGYVTWHCSKYNSRKWHCDEFSSYTSFSFVAYTI